MGLTWIQPPFIIQEAFHALNPGGIFEIQDLVFDFHPDTIKGTDLEYWSNLVKKVFNEAHGVDLTQALGYKQCFQEQGFTDIHCEELEWPVGPERSAFRTWCNAGVESMLTGISNILIRTEVMTSAELEVLLAFVRRDLKNETTNSSLKL